MNVYYLKDEDKVGPCTPEMLRNAEAQGDLTDETLAWHDELEEWQPWQTVKALPELDVFLNNTVTCVVCENDVPKEASLEFGGDIVCAGCKNTYVQGVKEGVTDPAGRGIWRKKKTLIVTPSTEFPDRCVKCNKPSEGFRKKVRLIYHPPYVILLFLFIGIFALLLGKKHQVEIGLCKACRKKRTTGILLGVSSILLFFGGCFGGIGVSQNAPTAGGFMMIGGIILGVIVAIIGIIMSTLVRAKHIGPEYVKITGAGKPFLDSLQDFEH